MLRTFVHLSVALALVSAGARAETAEADEDPLISTKDGGIDLRVKRDAHATISRRETNTIDLFSVVNRLGAVEQKMSVIEAKLSTLPDTLAAMLVTLQARPDPSARIDQLIGDTATNKADITQAKTKVDSMETQVDRIDGLVKDTATNTASLGHANDLIDRLEVGFGKLETEVEGLETTLQTGLGNVNTRVDGVGTRLDGVTSSIQTKVTEATAPVVQKVATLETKVASVETKVTGVDGKVTSEVGRIETEMDTELNRLKADVSSAVAALKTDVARTLAAARPTHIYYNWNRKTCNNLGSFKTLKSVYEGVVWGSHHDHNGGSTLLCLKKQNSGNRRPHGSNDQVYPTSASNCNSYASIGQCDRVLACVMCEIQSHCYEQWGSTSCEATGYKPAYTGWTYASHYGHRSNMDRVCLDRQQQLNNDRGHQGSYIYPTTTQNYGDLGKQDSSVPCAMCCKTDA